MFHRNISFIFLGIQHFQCCKNNELVIFVLTDGRIPRLILKSNSQEERWKGGEEGWLHLRCEKIMFSHSLCKKTLASKEAENILFPLGSEAYYRKHEDSCSYILKNKYFTCYDNLFDHFQNKIKLIKNIKTKTPQSSFYLKKKKKKK